MKLINPYDKTPEQLEAEAQGKKMAKETLKKVWRKFPKAKPNKRKIRVLVKGYDASDNDYYYALLAFGVSFTKFDCFFMTLCGIYSFPHDSRPDRMKIAEDCRDEAKEKALRWIAEHGGVEIKDPIERPQPWHSVV